MSWNFGGKATDVGFEAEVKRAFAEAEGQVQSAPASVRALRAIQAFVVGAPLNIPQGCTVAFFTNGHLEQDGRGELTVSVKISDTPVDVAPRARARTRVTS